MRIAVLGMGSIGRRHAGNLRMLGHEIVAYDLNIQVQEALKAEYTMHAVLQDLWATKPAIAMLCSPPAAHLELAIEALRHNCHVFVEKPLGISTDGWRELAQALDDRGLINMVGCNWRFHLAFTAEGMKEWIPVGAVRRLANMYAIMAYDLRQRPDYRTSYAAEIGATFDVAWHLVDLAQWIFGPGVLAGANIWPASQIGLSCDGTAEIRLAHPNGNKSFLLGDFASGVDERSISIVGADSEPDFKLLLCPSNQMYVDEMRHFLRCVQAGQQTFNPISKAVGVLEILLEAKKGTWQKL